MFKLVILALFAVLPFEGLAQLCPTCPIGFSQHGDKCYRAFTEPRNWDAARFVCNQYDSHLVVVHDEGDNEGIREVIEPLKERCTYGAFWTAGRKKCPNNFVWYTGYGTLWPIEYTNWIQGEPNNAKRNEFCIAIQQVERNPVGWIDEACSAEFCFLCEYDV